LYFLTLLRVLIASITSIMDRGITPCTPYILYDEAFR
jgi:hypothetical protein